MAERTDITAGTDTDKALHRLLDALEQDMEPGASDSGTVTDRLVRAAAFVRNKKRLSMEFRREKADRARQLEEMTAVLMSMAALDFSHRIEVTGSDTTIDTLAAGLNMLAEELEATAISRSYLTGVLQSMPDMLLVVGEDGTIRTVNDATLETLGYNRQDIAGKCPGGFIFTGADAAHVLPITGLPACPLQQVWYKRKDGQLLPVAFSCSTLEGDKDTGYTCILNARDITEQKAAADAVKTSENRFRALFNNISSGVAVYDVRDSGSRFVFRDLNRAAEKIDGVSRDDVAGREVREVFPGIDEMGLLDVFRRVWESGTPEELPAMVYRDDRRTGWRENYIYKLPSGEIVAVYDDVTERIQAKKLLEESEKKYRTILKTVPSGIFGVDRERTVIMWNHAAEVITGMKAGDVIGRKCTDIWHCPRCLKGCGLINKKVSKPIHNVECNVTLPDGRKIYLQKNVDELRDETGQVIGGVESFVDITRKRDADLKMKEMVGALEKSNRELTDFAHIASHDLKEPLRKVITFGDRIKNKADNLDDRSRDYLDRMQNAAGRMTGLLDGLLEYARVTTKGQPFVSADLGKIAREVLSDLEVRVQETGAEVTLENLPVIMADPLQMRQLLQNLIGNALKYHRPGVSPVVTVTGRQEDGSAVITVEDNGIGIAPEDREKAFGVFQRLVGKNEFEGTGVGLSICKKIVERHGGTITITDAPDPGAVIAAVLPLSEKGDA